MQAEDEAFKDVLMTIFPIEQRVRAYRGLHRLVARAKEDGALRDDFAVQDLSFIFWGNAAFLAATKGIADPSTWRRYVKMMIRSCRSELAEPLSEPPLTAAQLAAAVTRLRETFA
jgi:hypothetical protein